LAGNRVKDRVALVIGGARGIGRASVEALHRAGAKVLVADLACDQPLPPGVAFVATDAADPSQVDRAVAETVSRFGRLDALHANAGIVVYRPFLEMDLPTWRKVMSVNLDGVFNAVLAASRVMAAQGGGAIVVTSSVRAAASSPQHTAYSASKGGIDAMVTQLATELALHGIRINAVRPGGIDTPMMHEAAERFFGGDVDRLAASFLGMVPLRRIGSAAEIGEAVLFLLSDAASYITGAHLDVDGGMLSRLA